MPPFSFCQQSTFAQSNQVNTFENVLDLSASLSSLTKTAKALNTLFQLIRSCVFEVWKVDTVSLPSITAVIRGVRVDLS